MGTPEYRLGTTIIILSVVVFMVGSYHTLFKTIKKVVIEGKIYPGFLYLTLKIIKVILS